MAEEILRSQVTGFRSEDLIVTLEGDLMVDGAIEYKTLVKILTGTAGAIDEIGRISNFPHQISYTVKPPKEKCFEIIFRAVELVGAVSPLIPNLITGKDLLGFFIEYLKLKASTKDRKIARKDIIANGNTGITIIGNDNNIHFNIPLEIALGAVGSRSLNKKVDEAITAMAKDTSVDSLEYVLPGEEKKQIKIPKTEIDQFRYVEETTQQEDQLVGYVREIDNTDYKGYLNILDGGKFKSIRFELDIKDISRLEEIVSQLCIAEATKSRVALIGEKTLDKNGHIKSVKVYDIKIVDNSFEL